MWTLMRYSIMGSSMSLFRCQRKRKKFQWPSCTKKQWNICLISAVTATRSLWNRMRTPSRLLLRLGPVRGTSFKDTEGSTVTFCTVDFHLTVLGLMAGRSTASETDMILLQVSLTFLWRLLSKCPALFEWIGLPVDGTLFTRVFNSLSSTLPLFRENHFHFVYWDRDPCSVMLPQIFVHFGSWIL